MQKIVCEVRSLWRADWPAHPGPSFLNFGRVRIPGSSGSRFAPLTQVDTVEDVPSTLVSTVAPTAMVAEHIRSTVHVSDTETVPTVAGSGESLTMMVSPT